MEVDRSSISSDQKRLFFAVSLYPFHFLQTLSLKTIFFLEKVEIQQQIIYTVYGQYYNTYILLIKKVRIVKFFRILKSYIKYSAVLQNKILLPIQNLKTLLLN